MKKFVVLLLTWVLIFNFSPSTVFSAESTTDKLKVVYFYSPDCADCTAMVPYFDAVEQSYPDVELIKYDASKPNYENLLKTYGKVYKIPEKGIGVYPVVFIKNLFFIGEDNIKENLENEIMTPSEIQTMVLEVEDNNNTGKTEIILKIGNPKMQVNGTETEIDPGKNTVPLVISGRTLVPIRSIVETLNGSVGWDGTQKKVTIKQGSDLIELKIGSKEALVNGNKKELDVAPQVINARTMLPLRFVTEVMGCKVGWNGTTKTVTITKDAA